MHHKKGQPSAVTSHESRPGKPSCSILGFCTSHTRWGKTDNSNTSGPSKLLGFYPKHQHEMLHNDAVQHRAGEQPPASAPMAPQNPAKAHTAAKFKIPSRRQASRRQEIGAATGSRAGDNDTLPICIRDKHSPPPTLRPTTLRPMLQRIGYCTEMG